MRRIRRRASLRRARAPRRALADPPACARALCAPGVPWPTRSRSALSKSALLGRPGLRQASGALARLRWQGPFQANGLRRTGVELCREDLSALVVMECARRDPTALRRRRTCESGAKGQSSSSLCSELGCVTCHVDGSVSTRTSVGRCVRVSFVRRSMDRSTCYATCVYQQGQRPRVGVARLECAGSDERGGRNAVGVAKSIQDGPKHVCAKQLQNDFPPNSSSSLEVTAKDVAHRPPLARSANERERESE